MKELLKLVNICQIYHKNNRVSTAHSVYDHITSTLQTDGLTTCLGNTARSIAECGKTSKLAILYLGGPKKGLFWTVDNFPTVGGRNASDMSKFTNLANFI